MSRPYANSPEGVVFDCRQSHLALRREYQSAVTRGDRAGMMKLARQMKAVRKAAWTAKMYADRARAGMGV